MLWDNTNQLSSIIQNRNLIIHPSNKKSFFFFNIYAIRFLHFVFRYYLLILGCHLLKCIKKVSLLAFFNEN